MFPLFGYIFEEKIHENSRLSIYRGYTLLEQLPVVIKMLKPGSSTSADAAKLIHEYEITRCLQCYGIVKPIRLEWGGETLALIMADSGAVSLNRFLSQNQTDLSLFFSVARQLAQILGEMHGQGVIHGNLTPGNILFHPQTRKVEIIDFSNARFFTAQMVKSPAKSKLLEADPAYLAPEHTGRTSYIVDQRSDLYSLGVVLYQVLTGRFPFSAEQPIEWFHAHLTQMPVPPEKVTQGVPPLVSAVIMKLLAKVPQDRYQQAYSLLADLTECQRQWLQTGSIRPFLLGQADLAGSFRPSPKIYGREKEKEAIRQAVAMARKGKAGLLLVTGQPGTGKTALVMDTLNSLRQHAGFIITGKFEQFGHSKPYAPFRQAFGQLVRQLLTESPDNLEDWKKKIALALGQNGAAVTGIIPEVELLVGLQQPLETLQPQEAKNRFHLVFQNFVRVFAKREHPMVLFLDDLQWADSASLQLIQYLCEETEEEYLLVIGAYRNNETTSSYPLQKFLAELQKTKVPLETILLKSLTLSDTGQFIADTLCCDRERAQPLAKAFYQKTRGNPLFLRQLFKLVYDNGLLFFNEQYIQWEWEQHLVEELPVFEEVAGLMLKKLQRLPAGTLDVLKTAALIGNPFDLGMLTAVAGKSLKHTVDALEIALLEGLILPAADYNIKGANKGANARYSFLDDRVHQAVYDIVPEEEGREIHLRIGRQLLKEIDLRQSDVKIFEMMNHFNRCQALVNNPAERIMLAEYNLLAGRRAKSAIAYDTAFDYFRAGLLFLPPDPWVDYYHLTYNLYLECFQSHCLLGDFQRGEQLFEILLKKTKDKAQIAALYALKIRLVSGSGQHRQAVQIGIKALSVLGVPFPARAGKLAVMREILLTKWCLRNKKVSDLVNRPAMNDQYYRNLMELLTVLAVSSNPVDLQLYVLTVLKAGKLSVKYGNTDYSPIGYLGFSIALGSVLGNYKTAHAFEQTALRLSEKYYNNSARCLVNYVLGSSVSHWTQHGQKSLEYLQKAVREGMEAGEVNFAGAGAGFGLETQGFLGVTLPEIYEECKRLRRLALKIKHRTLKLKIIILERFCVSLMGFAGEKTEMEDSECSEYNEELFKKVSENILAAYYLSELQLAYLTGEYRAALAIADKADRLMSCQVRKGYLNAVDFFHFQSLAITAVYEDLTSGLKKRYGKTLQRNQKQMKKWAESCPDNFEHKYLLVEAERARLAGLHLETMSLWDKAIQAARENGFVQNEAIAGELAARYYLLQGRHNIARTYLSEAWSKYVHWGAVVKAKALQQRHPELLKGLTVEKINEKRTAEYIENFRQAFCTESEPAAGSGDLSTIKKVVQALSEESSPEAMLKMFLTMAMENAGANRGFLILEQLGELFIEAFQENGTAVTDPAALIPLEESPHLSRAVVRYVARTLETVVINQPRQTGTFARDPYFAKSPAQSIVCLPVFFQGIPAGVLYLENTLMPGVFVPERLEMLKLLSTQMIYVNKLKTFLGPDIPKFRDKSSLPKDALTERELEVIRLISEGLSNKEIAQRLVVTLSTVKSHILNIYGKLQVNRRVQAVTMAKELNLI